MESFLEEAGTLGRKLTVLLVQLPPKHGFDADVAARFFSALAERLHQVVLNLSTLQEDLRIKDRELRRRLRNLPDAAAPAPRSQRAA